MIVFDWSGGGGGNNREKLICPAILHLDSCHLGPSAGIGKSLAMQICIVSNLPAEGCKNGWFCWFFNPLVAVAGTTLRPLQQRIQGGRQKQTVQLKDRRTSKMKKKGIYKDTHT